MAVWWRTESEEEERSPHLYIMNADGSGQRRLMAESLGTSAGATFSPDGLRMVFSRKAEGQPSDIFVANADGSDPRRLSDDDRTNSSAAFSPDGSLIAFYSDDGETSNIEVIRPDGSGRRAVVKGGKHWYPQWSPDGAWLLYTTAPDPQNLDDLDLYMTPLDASSPPRPLIQAPGREPRAAGGRIRRCHPMPVYKIAARMRLPTWPGAERLFRPYQPAGSIHPGDGHDNRPWSLS
ncbi:MAG TPA: hypothetical protein VLU25_03375 [Acidobacteriota bacterium]|nr:hypothetical protein [Acidobacteriota bacterium]